MKTLFCKTGKPLLFVCAFALLAAFAFGCDKKVEKKNIELGDMAVSLRDGSFVEGKIVSLSAGRCKIAWLDGYGVDELDSLDVSPITPLDAEEFKKEKIGICKWNSSGLWKACKVELTAANKLKADFYDEDDSILLGLGDFIKPEGDKLRKELVRQAAGELVKELLAATIKAESPPLGMGSKVSANMFVLVESAPEEYAYGRVGLVSDSGVSVLFDDGRNAEVFPASKVAPLSGGDFDRSVFERNVNTHDIIYAKYNGSVFLPAKISSIAEDGQQIDVRFASGDSIRLVGPYWLPMSN